MAHLRQLSGDIELGLKSESAYLASQAQQSMEKGYDLVRVVVMTSAVETGFNCEHVTCQIGLESPARVF